MSALNIAIADRYPQIAEAISDALGRDHAVETHYAHTPDALKDLLPARKIDILLINADLAVQSGINVVTSVRRMEHGFEGNPFVVIATIVHDRHKVHVPAVLEAGVDCGLLVPAAIETMVSSLLGVIEARRKWVFVPPYIGPDRRPPLSGVEDPSLVVVPNTALPKLEGDRAGLAKAQAAVSTFAGRVEDVAIRAVEAQLSRLIGQINDLSVPDMVMMLPSIRTQLAYDLGVLGSIPKFSGHPKKGPLLKSLQESVLRAIPTKGADPATLERLQAATNELAKSLERLPG
jgi:DNA-binding response OmpR family regulator